MSGTFKEGAASPFETGPWERETIMGQIVAKLLAARPTGAQQPTAATTSSVAYVVPDTNPPIQTQTSRAKQPYKYSPLVNPGSIRILALLPNNDPGAPLHCQLIEHALREATDQPDLFEALSYVWGSSDKPHSISIGPDSTIPITTSLHAALLRLRGRSVQRFIWIDAVCINQEDLGERASQIRLMAEIYSRASCVVIWLGGSEDKGEQALERLRVMATLANVREAKINGPSSVDSTNEEDSAVLDHRGHDNETYDRGDDESCSSGWSDEEYGSSCDGSSDDEDDDNGGSYSGLSDQEEEDSEFRQGNDACSENGDRLEGGFDLDEKDRPILLLLQRPWFQRVWVLQEAAAAHHVLVKCGTAEMDGYTFFLGIQQLPSPLQSLVRRVRSTVPVVELIGGSIFRPKSHHNQTLGEVSLNIRPLHELLDMYRAHNATDPRDKIFALLGMSSDLASLNAAGIEPNYTIAWTNLVYSVTKFILGSHVFVEPTEKAEGVTIKGTGYVLGRVAAVETDNTNGGQHVSIVWKGGNRPSKARRFPALATRVQKRDIVCQLSGCERLMLIRPRQDLGGAFLVIAIAFAADDEPQARRTMAAESRADFEHSFVLVWDWGEKPEDKASCQQTSDTQPVALQRVQAVQICSAALILEDSGSYQASSDNFRAAAQGLEMPQELGGENEWEKIMHLIQRFRRARIRSNSQQLEPIGVRASVPTEHTEQSIENRGERLLTDIAALREEMAEAVGDDHKKLLLREAIKLRQQTNERNHPDTLLAREKLALIQGIEQCGLTTDPESWFQLVEDRIRAQGVDHPDVAISFDRFMSLAQSAFSEWAVFSRWVLGIKMLLGREAVTEERAASIVQEERVEFVTLLLEEGQGRVPITDGIFQAAARNCEFGVEVVKLLLDKAGSESFKITKAVMECAVGNDGCGEDVLKLLLDRSGSQFPLNEEIIKAAAENQWLGEGMVKLLMERAGGDFPLNEGILKATIPHFRVLSLLLERVHEPDIISEALLETAAENWNCQDSFRMLLEKKGDSLELTTRLLRSAARYPENLGCLLNKVTDNSLITEDVVIVAAEYSRSVKPEKSPMGVLLQREGAHVKITKRVIQEVEEGENYLLLDFILRRRGNGAVLGNGLAGQVQKLVRQHKKEIKRTRRGFQ